MAAGTGAAEEGRTLATAGHGSRTPAGEDGELGVLGLEDPARNPGISATGTWARADAAGELAAVDAGSWQRLREALEAHGPTPTLPGLTLLPGSVESAAQAAFIIARLADGQRVLLELVPNSSEPRLAGEIARVALPDGAFVVAHATDAAVLHQYLRDVAVQRGPRAFGPIPRLGIGTRMTTACWPGVFAAMQEGGFAANPIQNSVRELNFLDDLVSGRPAERNYAPGFGTIESGYTGSSFEGLWTWGVLDALGGAAKGRYGADADHIQVKRGPSGLDRARRYVDSFRYYTFFTIDMADILDFTVMSASSDSLAWSRSQEVVGDDALHREVVRYHLDRGHDRHEPLSEALVHRLIAKYWNAFESLSAINEHIRRVKGGEAYDLEFTIDEHPPEISAFDCLTTEEECLFIIEEAERRELPVTHIAPNVGTEKGFDYRGADGVAGFERRVGSLSEVIASRDLIIDIHSADDLSGASRAAVRRATGGRLHYKISPVLQLLFAEVLETADPALFEAWWDDAYAYAQAEAARGSSFAAECIAHALDGGRPGRSSRDMVFHHYSFRFPGRRGPDGRFLVRERFYSLPPEFYRAHEERVSAFVRDLAAELFA